MPELPPVDGDERLGRQVHSESRAKAARDKGRIRRDIFEPDGDGISVDRLSHASLTVMESFGLARGESLGRAFHGWAVVRAADAVRDNRSVAADPLIDNPYHANIVLPLVDHDRSEWRDIRKQHAQQLADFAEWLDRPPSTADQE